MRIDEQARQCVSFLHIGEQGSQPDRMAFRPVGTAFYVGIDVGRDRWVNYAVTARHVIDASRPHGDLYIRCVNAKGQLTVMRLPHDDWWLHPTTDVAATRVCFSLEEFGFKMLPSYLFGTDEWLKQHDVGIGDRLIIPGMFTQFIGGLRDEPVLRFGRISLMPKEKIKIPPQGGLPGMEIDAVLAEIAAWGGQSGSPVFVYFSVDRNLFAGDQLSTQIPNPRLIGLVHGHYNVIQRLVSNESEYSDLHIPLNAGIAIIVPAAKIQELLMMEMVVEDRERVKQILREEGLID